MIRKMRRFRAKKTASLVDKRYYAIEAWEDEQLVRTFVGVVSCSQATRPDSDVERWCELYCRQLPDEGCAREIDLKEVRIE